MGIQNATVTRLSDYDIRATHMTGIITDLGIEIGKWLFDPEKLNRIKFRLLILVITSFFIGGIFGAYAFNGSMGTSALFLLGGILVSLSIFPIYKDVHIRFRYIEISRDRRRRKRS